MLNLTNLSEEARTAVSHIAPDKARDLNHRVTGTDDILLAIMSKQGTDKEYLPSPARRLFNKCELSQFDIRLAIQRIAKDRHEEPTVDRYSKGVRKALRRARWNVFVNYHFKNGTVSTVRRWDIFVALVQTKDATFQLLVEQLEDMYGIGLDDLKAALNNRPKASALAHH